MKQAAGALIQNVDPGPPGKSRSARVYQALVDAVLDGRLPAGTRLPSARQLAAEWKVARGVVDDAFARLQDDGLLIRRVGDGSYIAHRALRAAPRNEPAVQRTPNAAAQRVLAHFAPYMAQVKRFELSRRSMQPLVLHPRAWPEAEFPLATWRRLVNQALSEANRHQLGYGPSAGVAPLRAAIARQLALTRSVRCQPEQVIVVNSATQALETIIRVLLSPGDKVWVEDPGHPSLPLLFEMHHTQAVGVPLDGLGLDVARGRERAPDAALVYLHPLTQYPLGVRTGAVRSAELLQWADESGAWIVEGCFNDEIVHRGPAPPALQSRDPSGRVLLMGTLEGVMFPSLRVAYLVVPERLVDVFVAARGLLGDHTQTPTQLALARFIDEGHLTRHVRHLRQTCGERREALIAAARHWLPADVSLGPTDSGLHACLQWPASLPDRHTVPGLQQRQVGAEALSTRCWQVADRNGLILSYAAASPDAIDSAVRGIAEAIDEARRGPVAQPAV